MRSPVRRPSRRAAAAAVPLSLLLVLAGCGGDAQEGERANAPSEATRTGTSDDDLDADAAQALETEEVATGLTSPWGMVATEDGAVLLSERDTGRILRLDPATGERTELRTLPDDIPGGAGFHQGGRLVVGPDDLLYVGTGDNGVPESAQDTDSLSGKVLRLTLDGRPAPDNPFGNEVFTYGHRNVEGLAFDDDGRLWASEFGSDAWDELNLLEAGADYGWPQVEGSGGEGDQVDPEVVWSTADASPSGLAWWDGSLWMAGLRGERLWEIPLADGGSVEQPVAHLSGELGRLRSVLPLPADPADGAPGEPGPLLLATSNTDGRGDVRDGDDRLLLLRR